VDCVVFVKCNCLEPSQISVGTTPDAYSVMSYIFLFLMLSLVYENAVGLHHLLLSLFDSSVVVGKWGT
jgi:hypothetical protein